MILVEQSQTGHVQPRIVCGVAADDAFAVWKLSEDVEGKKSTEWGRYNRSFAGVVSKSLGRSKLNLQSIAQSILVCKDVSKTRPCMHLFRP